MCHQWDACVDFDIQVSVMELIAWVDAVNGLPQHWIAVDKMRRTHDYGETGGAAKDAEEAIQAFGASNR